MEKQPYYEETERLIEPSERAGKVPRSFPKSLIISLLLAGLFWRFHGSLSSWAILRDPEIANLKHFSWNDLHTRPYLDYTSCYHKFQCARLELPMDYWNGTTDEKISLAVIKMPATVPVTDPSYGGAILMNPGGPGGSGVGFLMGYAKHARDVIEGKDPDNKHFDLISFDPRGVGLSRPRAQCVDDYVFDGSWSLRVMEQGVFSSSDAALSQLWSLYEIRSGLCGPGPFGAEEPDVKKYVSTASVSRDMLELAEKHGEWREKEASRLLATTQSITKIPETVKYEQGKEKINYIGFSYGSLLGNTFAAMYPDRINRLVVDGVIDAIDYTQSLWLDNLMDTEKDLDQFYYHCARVGYPKCALATSTGNTTEEGIRNKTLGIIADLYHNPLPVLYPSDVITYSDIKLLMLGALYDPIGTFPFMAWILEMLNRREGQFLAGFGLHRFNCANCCVENGSCKGMEQFLGATFLDPSLAIACGDGDSLDGVTKAEFEEHIQKANKLSPNFGEIWADHRLGCIHYHVRPVHRFKGPWEGNTSHPILQIGNTADPVTPGRFAKKMAKGFPGAVALIQDTPGHCSLAVPSNCTESYVRQYFQTGELPEPDTVCQGDRMPFGSASDHDETVDAETMQRFERASDFSKAMLASGGGFSRGFGFRTTIWPDLLASDSVKRST